MYNKHMEIIRADKVPTISAGNLTVQEHDFADQTLNDAYITINGRYPDKGYVANRVCTALVSIEDGVGSITIKGESTTDLAIGDRILIQPGEPYYFLPRGELAIRYISTSAWRSNQAFAVE